MRCSRCGICVAVISALLCSLAAAAFADVIAIRVGAYDNAPKIYTNTDGTVSGFWPDLIRQIAAEEGWEIEWLAGSWSQCLERLEAGAIDILPDTGWTEPRSLKYAFTQETVLVSWSLVYVPQGSNIESLIDLDGKTVAALRGSINLDGPDSIRELAQAFELDVTFLEMENYEQVFEALEKGEVDAGVTNKDFGNQHEDLYDVERTPIIFQPSRIQFALPKDAPLTPYLIERIDVNMKAFKQDKASAYYQALAEHIGSQEAGVHIEFIPRWARIALLAGGGVLLFLLAVGITSQLQVRRRTSELRESEHRYRELFENSPVPLWEQDFTSAREALMGLRQLGVEDLEVHLTTHPEDLIKCADLITVTDVNQASVSLFHAKSKVALMESIGNVFVEESGSVFLKSLLNIDACVGSFASDLVLQTLDGDRLVVAFQWTEIRGRVLASTQDISARILAEKEKLATIAQLRQSQKLESIGTLASGVAHEINNPLMGMMNYAELVKDKAQDQKSVDYLTEIGIEGNRIAKIVRNLLSFSRQDTEAHSPARMTDIVDDSLSLVGSVLRKDQITIELDIPEDLPQLKCRSQQIQQVVVNLLTNAHAALNTRYPEYDKNKILRITARPFESDGADWIRTTVEDHGIGIPEDEAQRIFDPFFTTKPRDEGTGLGLSVSFGIVREHHGELTVESVPGEYTRFHIDLRVNNGWNHQKEQAT